MFPHSSPSPIVPLSFWDDFREKEIPQILDITEYPRRKWHSFCISPRKKIKRENKIVLIINAPTMDYSFLLLFRTPNTYVFLFLFVFFYRVFALKPNTPKCDQLFVRN